jgi:diguanylate cyclase (GGDEF)-like protein/PAS domain S-box-containing protein
LTPLNLAGNDVRSIGDILAGLRRDLSLSAMPPHLAEGIRIQQLNRLAFFNRIMPLTGINTLLFVVWACWDEGRPNLLLFTLVGIVSLYILLMARASRWQREAEPGRAAERHLRSFNTLFVPLGVFWGILLVGLVPGGDAAQRSLLHGIAVGVVSSAALNVPVSAVFAFGLPVTIGAFGSVIATNEWESLPTAACLLGYVALTLAYALYSNRTFIDRIRNEIRLKEQAEVIGLLLRDFVENSSDWLWETDDQLRLKGISDRMAQVMGAAVQELCGSSLETLIGRITDDGGKEHVSTLMQCLSSRSSFRDIAIPVRVAGETRWWSMTGKPSFDKHGVFTGYHGIGSDVTAARRSTEQISYLAHHDSLTSLPNRTLFTDVLTRSCAQLGTDDLALLCLDLDEFKAVNDTMGHAVGDALLVAVADRLRRCIREGDLAARLGGDEFAIIMADATPADAAQMASRIVERLSQPYGLNGQPVEIGVSVGVVLAQPEQNEPSKLLQNADLALYRAKAEGRGTWRFFEAAMDEQVQDRQVLRTELRRALERGEFRLEFQPVIGLSSGVVVAVEALLRWRHPTRGTVPPIEFVPLAEEADLIGPIGAWVLDQAIMEAARWPAPVVVAVNLSPLQFRDPGLVSAVTNTLQAHGLPPSRLELEITESILLKPTAQTLDALRRLRKLGVRIALDDFGTGYSSLSYLRRFPFDTIKIDRSFVSDLGHDKAASAIIKAISEIARNVEMTVTAEGVETEEQAAILHACGCERMQGFLFSPPRSAAEVRLYIAEIAAKPYHAGQRVDAGVALV